MSAQTAMTAGPEESRGSHLAVAATPADPSPRTAAVCRRFALAVRDLGLVPVTGGRWAVPAGVDIGFATLSLSAADRLVRALEDLAAPTAGPWPAPTGDVASRFEQLSLF